LEVARRFVQTHVLDAIDASEDLQTIELLNSKSILQERAQALGLPTPRYTTIETSGPEHAKIFLVEGRIGNQFTSRAEATSKKEASQRAAQILLEQLPSG
jgi:ribonuclease-3